ncbi:MAG: hypothetical protein JXB15_06235 [Anaerolineales bacterium]|nr:hypothetical protein [Anaerolineales bacterium]
MYEKLGCPPFTAQGWPPAAAADRSCIAFSPFVMAASEHVFVHKKPRQPPLA